MRNSALIRFDAATLGITPAHRLMETGLSSNAAPAMSGFRTILSAVTLMIGVPVAAQDDTGVTPPPAETPPAEPAEQPAPPPPPPRVNLMVTVPRGEINQAQAQECEDRADAGAISGEIVVCRQVGDDGSNSLSSSRAEAQKRYAQETMLKGGTRAPDFIADCNDQGNPFGCVGFGKAPPAAYMVDFDALPKAPAGSDADRIARGLPPLNEERELTEEEEKARREAAGIKTTVPARSKKKGG